MGDAPAGADRLLAELGLELAEQVTAALPSWSRRAVAGVLDAWSAAGGTLAEGAGSADDVLARAEEAGRQAAIAVGHDLRALAGADVDAQRATPLQVVRGAVAWPTAVLAGAGVPAVARDRFDEERFPDDPYGLTPASLDALAPALGELALAWGAAKAAAHRTRHDRG